MPLAFSCHSLLFFGKLARSVCRGWRPLSSRPEIGGVSAAGRKENQRNRLPSNRQRQRPPKSGEMKMHIRSEKTVQRNPTGRSL